MSMISIFWDHVNAKKTCLPVYHLCSCHNCVGCILRYPTSYIFFGGWSTPTVVIWGVPTPRLLKIWSSQVWNILGAIPSANNWSWSFPPPYLKFWQILIWLWEIPISRWLSDIFQWQKRLIHDTGWLICFPTMAQKNPISPVVYIDI